ncbi:hypothetical protein TUM19329_11240 [Legionella antarctica]|uniref:Uncharacterized protein n=1 Tax=Legionella antarctica TaxID=2708020 RepID=A0A6F8T3H9_9GAMM|nr:hypothetical protein [Legionella antarctica]BCA94763.1 hypothetical protein TUM19329_11240 [Legionella antarctica]
MFGFFAKKVAVNTGTVIASAGIANISYALGASIYEYGSHQFEAMKNKSLLGQSSPSQDREEHIRALFMPLSY